jgi:hypothetical protein
MGRRSPLIRRHRPEGISRGLGSPAEFVLGRVLVGGQLGDMAELVLARPAGARAPAAAARDRAGMFLLPGRRLAQRRERGFGSVAGARLRRRGAPLRLPQPFDRP